ncbi:MAG: type II secretion system protein [Gammaproteobacteria bacterium]|nr:type II secretion system protein [Gammaproteobacteria bacterium]
MSRPNVSLTRGHGFTLLELIMGIVVFSIAMTMLSTLILPLAARSTDPVFQIRATKLANALINEISAKPYDEQSKPWLGLGRCDEAANSDCTLAGALGPDLLGSAYEARDLFDDVDDYHGLSISGQHLYSGAAYEDLYLNYRLTVTVFYDGDFDGLEDASINSRSAKLIQVAVTTPSNEVIEFAAYRSNY